MMVDLLETKRDATKFRILVAIAERQPAVSQGEIADSVGVTSQAVSEYIRELIEDGYVDMEARSRYRVTKEGVDWLLQSASAVRRYADHVTNDVLGALQEDAAIAATDVDAGAEVNLRLEDGLLTADPDGDGTASGRTTTAGEAGAEVGVTGFQGIIDIEPGAVSVVKIPAVTQGGSDAVDVDRLHQLCDAADLVTCGGVEAVVAARSAGVQPTGWFAPEAVAADAASRGLDVVVLATVDRVGGVTDTLSDADLQYDILEVSESED